MAVDDGAVVDVVADAAGEGGALAVAAEAGEVVGGVEVGDALDFLLDDGAGIEIRGDVVAGGADEFHAALVGLAVGVRADEGGEEGVVDVDDFPGELLAEAVRQDLHEAGEDDELDVLGEEEIADFGKAFFAQRAVHLDVVEGEAGAFGDVGAVVAVPDEGGDLDGELAELGAEEDFVEAVVGLCDEDGGAHFIRQLAEVPGGAEGAAEGAEAGFEILDGDIESGGIDLEAGEEFFPDLVGKLAELGEVSLMGGDVGGDFRDDAGLVGRG